jgi:hypothetical protein
VTSASEDGALGSVLDLERTLETAQTAAVAAEKRLEEARREADRIITAARKGAERRTAQRRSSLDGAAEAEAKAAAQDARAAAAALRAKVSEVEDAFAERALTLVLPGAQEATWSSR